MIYRVVDYDCNHVYCTGHGVLVLGKSFRLSLTFECKAKRWSTTR
jgi:hypothetical protein